MKRTKQLFCFLILTLLFLSACGNPEKTGKPYLIASERSAIEEQFFNSMHIEVFAEDPEYASITLRNPYETDLLKVKIYHAETKDQIMEFARLSAGTEVSFIDYWSDCQKYFGAVNSSLCMDYIIGDYQYHSQNYPVRTEIRKSDAVFYLETEAGLQKLDLHKGISFANGVHLSGLKDYLFYEIKLKDMDSITPSYGRSVPYNLSLSCRAERVKKEDYNSLIVKVMDKDGLIYDSNSLWIDSSTGTGTIYFYTSYQTGIPAGEYILHFEIDR